MSVRSRLGAYSTAAFREAVTFSLSPIETEGRAKRSLSEPGLGLSDEEGNCESVIALVENCPYHHGPKGLAKQKWSLYEALGKELVLS